MKLIFTQKLIFFSSMLTCLVTLWVKQQPQSSAYAFGFVNVLTLSFLSLLTSKWLLLISFDLGYN